MKTDIQFWSYLAHFFLEWEMLQTQVVQTDEMHLTLPALQRALKRKKYGDGFEWYRPESRTLAKVNVWIFVGKYNFLPTRADLGSEPFKGLCLAAIVQRCRHMRWIFFSLTSSPMRIGFSLVVVVQILLYSFWSSCSGRRQSAW